MRLKCRLRYGNIFSLFFSYSCFTYSLWVFSKCDVQQQINKNKLNKISLFEFLLPDTSTSLFSLSFATFVKFLSPVGGKGEEYEYFFLHLKKILNLNFQYWGLPDKMKKQTLTLHSAVWKIHWMQSLLVACKVKQHESNLNAGGSEMYVIDIHTCFCVSAFASLVIC